MSQDHATWNRKRRHELENNNEFQLWEGRFEITNNPGPQSFRYFPLMVGITEDFGWMCEAGPTKELRRAQGENESDVMFTSTKH